MRFLSMVYIAARYLLTIRGSGFNGFLSMVTALSTIIGIAVMIFILNMMNGFERLINQRIVDTSSEISVDVSDLDHASQEALMTDIISQPDIEDAYLVGSATAIVTYSGGYALADIIFHESNHQSDKDVLQSYMSSAFAFQHEIIEGEAISLIFPGSLSLYSGTNRVDSIARNQNETQGITDRFDINLSVSDFTSVDQYIQSYVLNLNLVDPYEMDAITSYLAEQPLVGNYITWFDVNATLFRAIAIEKLFMMLLLGLVILIAYTNLTAILSQLIERKRVDISIMETLGLKGDQIRKIFLIYPVFLIGLSIFLGMTLGTLISVQLNEMTTYLYEALEVGFLPYELFFLSQVPAHLNFYQYLIIFLLFTLMAYLISLFFLQKKLIANKFVSLRKLS
ncbi:MAG: FtsX-like permease family protein [Gammaproteobacteria bacterium]